MKKNLFIILSLFIFSIHIYSQEENKTDNSKLFGTWVLLTQQFNDNPPIFFNQRINLYQKVYTKNTFYTIAAVTQKGTIIAATIGKYRLQGDVYTELLEYSMSKGNNLNKTESVFKMTFEGNKMYMSGTIADGKVTLREEWEKIE